MSHTCGNTGRRQELPCINCDCESSARPASWPVLLKKDRDWRDYPMGTKAHAYNGGAWLRAERGWTWNGHTRSPGSTFPTPGADAIGACVELPVNSN